MVVFQLYRTVKKQEKKIDELAAEVAFSKKTVLSLKGAVFAGSTSPEHSVEIPVWDELPTVSPGELVVYVHPICPFAQRAWIAALEKTSKARFIYIDLADKPTWYKGLWKEQTVPAIQYGPDFTMGDSMPCVEWIENKYKGEGTQLTPDSVDEQALIKSVMDLFGKKIVMPCYTLLKNQEPAKDAAIMDAVKEGMQWFEASLALGLGAPFFLGERFSVFEVACLPFFSRFRHTLKYWRGLDIMQPRLQLLCAWVQAGEARPSVKNSLRSGNYYNTLYSTYAGARGKSTL